MKTVGSRERLESLIKDSYSTERCLLLLATPGFGVAVDSKSNRKMVRRMLAE